MTEDDLIEIRTLAVKLLNITDGSAELFKLDKRNTDYLVYKNISHEFRTYPDKKLLNFALLELKKRNLRKTYFEFDLFKDGAWNILLDLFISELTCVDVSISSACIASDLPPTTALRWLGLMCDNEMLCRYADPDDKRRVYIRLSVNTMSLMKKLLSECIDLEERFVS